MSGVIVAGTEFFGEDEALREANRALVSAVHTDSPPDAWLGAINAAMASAAKEAPGAPIDKISIELKGQEPVISMYPGTKTGGEDRRLLFDARTGKFTRSDGYADKAFINRVHGAQALVLLGTAARDRSARSTTERLLSAYSVF